MATAKTGAPVVGFNHNVKYGPRVYHVQTEDSGLPHAHYITHLFVGGNIVASMKTSYADKAADPNLAAVVRSLMEGQHKHMLKRLVSGEFNELAERFSASYAPGVLADGSNQASYVNTDPSAPASAAAVNPAAKPAAPARPTPPAPAPAAKPAPPKPVQQPVWQASPPSASPAAPRAPGSPLPPVTRGPAQPTRPMVPPRMAQVVPPAPARPQAPSLFQDTPVERPHEDLPVLFAEELISEKSLDEVILAFLSADLEPPK